MIAGASLHRVARGRLHPPASGTVVGNPPAEFGSPLQHSPPSMRPTSGTTSHRAVQAVGVAVCRHPTSCPHDANIWQPRGHLQARCGVIFLLTCRLPLLTLGGTLSSALPPAARNASCGPVISCMEGNNSRPLATQSRCRTIPGPFVQAAAGTPRERSARERRL